MIGCGVRGRSYELPAPAVAARPWEPIGFALCQGQTPATDVWADMGYLALGASIDADIKKRVRPDFYFDGVNNAVLYCEN